MRAGHVTVAGAVIRAADHKVDPLNASVALRGVPVVAETRQVWMLHKPAGVVSATKDGEALTVLELLPPSPRQQALRVVGRLDKDTTGMLLLTDDGALLHRLTHPRRHVAKIYELAFEGVLVDPETRCQEGLALADGTVCKPAKFEPNGPGKGRLTLTEGKYHQVKRMIAALGGRVTTLHRAQVGGLRLDPDLASGKVRRLTDAEVDTLFAPTEAI